jgi:hypothetical protein
MHGLFLKLTLEFFICSAFSYIHLRNYTLAKERYYMNHVYLKLDEIMKNLDKELAQQLHKNIMVMES